MRNPIRERRPGVRPTVHRGRIYPAGTRRLNCSGGLKKLQIWWEEWEGEIPIKIITNKGPEIPLTTWEAWRVIGYLFCAILRAYKETGLGR